MTHRDDKTGPSRPLELAQRLSIIEELAVASFDVTCLDTSFAQVEVPEAIRALGMPESPRSEPGVDRPIDRVQRDDRPRVVSMIGQARSVGVARAEIGFTDRAEPTTLHVVDLTDAYGVFLFVRGRT